MSTRKLRVGEVLRYTKQADPGRELIDGCRNFHNITAMPGGRVSGLQLERGINAPAAVGLNDVSRIPAVLLRASPAKAGQEGTPWRDEIDLASSSARYFGDHKPATDGPIGATAGNRILLQSWPLHAGATPQQRLLAAPVLLFRGVEGRTYQGKAVAKGFVEFCGVGVIPALEHIEQADSASGLTFPNLLATIRLLDLTPDDDAVDWRWIDDRRNRHLRIESTLRHAPTSWSGWVESGCAALDDDAKARPGSARERFERVRVGETSGEQRVRTKADEIRLEQAYFDRAYEGRERKRRDLLAAPHSAAGPRASAAAVKRGAEKELESVGGPDDPVAIGRFDAGGEEFYVGRHVITGDNRDVLVMNWRAPAAAPFYEATFDAPLGVDRIRKFSTEKNTVLDFDETVLADLADRVAELTVQEQLGVDDAVLRDLDETRTGEMRDIVQTIHAAQYGLIREPLDQLTVIQGGPGTGKTVVALHRVSWLLFNFRDRLSADRVLVVGPNRTFTQYISRVLPGLGDNAVVHSDVQHLGPLASDSRAEEDEVSFVKGDVRMAGLLERGLWQRLRHPSQPESVEVGGPGGAAFDGEQVAARMREIRDASGSYLTGRTQFRSWLDRQARNAVRRTELITADTVDAALDRLWPTMSPQAFLRELLGSRDRLLAAAGDEFTAGEITRLQRSSAERISEETWSDADVALLDEAAALLGAGRETYDHIVVDEAQDLSPMQLRSIRRRSSTGSMTIVGDLAQSTGAWARDDWNAIAEGLSSSFSLPSEYRELDLGYRVPRQVFELAAGLLPQIAPSLSAPKVVREGPSDPDLIEVEDLDEVPRAAVSAAREYAGRGSFVGVICPDECFSELIGELNRQGVQYTDASKGKLGATINVVRPYNAKGLEFDAVVVVEPESIVGGSVRGLRELYVALTRTTKYLSVVHTGVVLPTVGDDSLLERVTEATVLPTPRRSTGGAPQPLFDDRPDKAPAQALSVGSRVAVAIAAAAATSLADDLRASVPEHLWPQVLAELRTRLGLSEQ